MLVVLNSFGLGLRLPIGELLGQALAHRRIAGWLLVINFIVIPVVFIGIALIGAIGLVLNVMLSLAETKVVHWKGR